MKATKLAVLAFALVFAAPASLVLAGDGGCGDGMKATKVAGGDSGCAKSCSNDMAAAEASEGAKGGAEDPGKAMKFGVKVGDKVEGIELPKATDGSKVALADGTSPATVVIFWNQNCPYVEEVQDRVGEFTKSVSAKGVRVLAVDAGTDKTSEDLKTYASTRPFTVLENRDSMTALRFGATRTPEAFVIDKNGVVRYHGAFDGGQKAPKETYVADAVNAILDGKEVAVPTKKAFGCSIKWSDEAKAALDAKKDQMKDAAKAKGEDARDKAKQRIAAKRAEGLEAIDSAVAGEKKKSE